MELSLVRLFNARTAFNAFPASAVVVVVRAVVVVVVVVVLAGNLIRGMGDFSAEIFWMVRASQPLSFPTST